ncbi:hypothetical protein NP233_g12163 [Leucocoprinus birnbaumii]|uniref:Hemerythrin-like domain-containing protein n=1 Tax=Leucocoprinus birnbaumii TaxID=56174 RepID=A0AAD5VG70_9AGAR|nr:hypothetical protein NP233_g12163 [Leucocoprinus birnbaumii]
MSFPTHPVEQLHFNMVHVHDTFKFGYESIMKNLDNPTATGEDLPNFLGYCLAWVTSIIHHHDIEEEAVFPFLNQKMDFSGEEEAHKAIHAGVDVLEKTLLEAQADNTKFDAAKVKDQIQQLAEHLFPHLDAEVKHLEPADVKKAGFDEGEFKAMNARLDKLAQTKGDPFVLVPFIKAHTPPELQSYWPNMPWYLRKIVIPYIFARRYSGYWKYAPYPI